VLVIGLTGGIATGKSSASALFKAHQIPIVDADVLARHVVLPGTPGLKKIVEYFGDEVLLPNGTLDRKKLGSIIFNDEVKRKKLNSIVHPAVRKAMVWKMMDAWISGEKYCIMDVPLLIEGGLWKWMGKVIVVHCPPEIQLKRLMSRDKSTQEEATSRLNSQMPIDEKLIYADIVLDNSGSPEALKAQVDALVKRLDDEVGYWWLVGWVVPFLAMFTGIGLLLWRWL
ncbi:dephospho-CoA kinase, partial [Collybia nuda]